MSVLAGGASRTTGRGGASAAWICRTAAIASGLPPLFLIACWRRANGNGGGGGAIRATTTRLSMAAGGCAALLRAVPSTACIVGTTAGANTRTGALASMR